MRGRVDAEVAELRQGPVIAMPPSAIAPGVFSSSRQVMPRCGGSAPGSVLTSSAMTPARSPLACQRFSPRHDPLVAVAHGVRADRLHVGAGVRLGHGEGGSQLAGREAGEEARALLVRAGAQQHRGHDEVRVEDARDAHPAARDLLDREAVGVQRVAEAAVARAG